jgi:hypothetical protein
MDLCERYLSYHLISKCLREDLTSEKCFDEIYLLSLSYLSFCFPSQANISCKVVARRRDCLIISFYTHYCISYLPIQTGAFLLI